MDEMWKEIIRMGVVGLGALIVWLVHTLSKPWFAAKTAFNKDKLLKDAEVNKEKIARDERLSLNGLSSQDKILERAFNNMDKLMESTLRTQDNIPKALDRMSDIMDTFTKKMDAFVDKMSIFNDKLEDQFLKQNSIIINEIKSYQIKELSDRIAQLPPESGINLYKKTTETETNTTAKL